MDATYDRHNYKRKKLMARRRRSTRRKKTRTRSRRRGLVLSQRGGIRLA